MNDIELKQAEAFIGLRIKKRRKKCGLTQKELADALGIVPDTLRSFEKGVTKPNQFMLYKLSRVFGITIDELVFDEIETECIINKYSEE
ncbi:helix-turn-helix domain-containing protein [Eubacterium multiforme]|uniref:Transcriptional regulator with XRE-family HTH domain n=1 Tax=Eubacterium multiforme TaxID=83339 RepID=A0ABT9UTI9_9FIRM|nr:helix-turn-helix transcriptional regulator [Eubacterium multiforme]MDQ0149611.1 transcriptional regulator with XRE-family HTH domain [Eubacterium multiforme]